MTPTSAVLRILIFIFFCAVSSTAQSGNSNSSCTSSCGNIRISFPYRLNGSPSSCGYPDPLFELDCQNNQPILSVRSKRFVVQQINYEEYTIRLVDGGIQRSNLSSCPVYFSVYDDWPSTIYDGILGNIPILFIYCLTPVNNSQYIEAPYCGNRSRIFSNSSQIYSYVVASDRVLVSELEESCAVYRMDRASTRRPFLNTSLAGIYDGLAYGFELSWYQVQCTDCRSRYGTCGLNGNEITCTYYCREDTPVSKLRFGCQVEYWGVIIGAYTILIVAGIVGLRFFLGFIFLFVLVVYKWRRRHLAMDATVEDFLQAQNNLMPIKYAYSEIKKMTNNFSYKLGEGGYGTVYRGKLRSGPLVAVKMMGGQSMASEQEFISEVGTIGRIHHVNIVQLIGFCVEGSKRCLVYEFLPSGSLDKYIFPQPFEDHLYLKYDKMFEIALGVARGIDYLHRGCDMQILHFDIKPHNVLLDEKFNAKISDFGLAKLYPTNNSAINLTAARGTMGYMAPEMFYKNIGGVSYKADVYSFGMLLLELAGRRKNLNPFAEDVGQIYFPAWVYDQLRAGNDIGIKDAAEEEKNMVKKIVIVALWCIQMNPSNRPPMNKVVEMLEGDSDLHMPPKPFLAPREITEDHAIS